MLPTLGSRLLFNKKCFLSNPPICSYRKLNFYRGLLTQHICSIDLVHMKKYKHLYMHYTWVHILCGPGPASSAAAQDPGPQQPRARPGHSPSKMWIFPMYIDRCLYFLYTFMCTMSIEQMGCVNQTLSKLMTVGGYWCNLWVIHVHEHVCVRVWIVFINTVCERRRGQ